MALTTVLGILPIAIAIVGAVIAPQIELPGKDYYIRTLVLLPFALALSVFEQSKKQTCS